MKVYLRDSWGEVKDIWLGGEPMALLRVAGERMAMSLALKELGAM